jgi:hypothetical protein
MTQYFLDSSALIKRYVVEPGTIWVRSITNRNGLGGEVRPAFLTALEATAGPMGLERGDRADA